MKALYNGKKVFINQSNEDEDIVEIKFIDCYRVYKSVNCHKAEVLDVVEDEFNEIEQILRDKMKHLTLPAIPTVNRKDLEELRKIF